eukprot:scaffold62695_cov70-Phaeocystis_antarctica.AAC.6
MHPTRAAERDLYLTTPERHCHVATLAPLTATARPYLLHPLRAQCRREWCPSLWLTSTTPTSVAVFVFARFPVACPYKKPHSRARSHGGRSRARRPRRPAHAPPISSIFFALRLLTLKAVTCCQLRAAPSTIAPPQDLAARQHGGSGRR